MNDTDKKLYELLGDKTLSFGCKLKLEDGSILTFTESYTETYIEYGKVCYDYSNDEYTIFNKSFKFAIIGHEPTIADVHKWMMQELKLMYQNSCTLGIEGEWNIFYDSSLSLLSQSEETKLAIISLIESYARE